MEKQHRYESVMLVDDSKLDRFILTRMIELQNFAGRVASFYSPREALEYVKVNLSDSSVLPEVVFVDLTMPEMNGLRFIRAFNKLIAPVAHNCKMVVLTSSLTTGNIAKEAERQRISHILNKPVSEAMLALL